MAKNKTVLASLVVAILSCAPGVLAQSTGETIRHHKVPLEDPTQTPELIRAEAELEKRDYPSAQALLRQVVARDPANYRAWFDLGFLLNAQGQTEDAIAAYRKSVAAKPDLFESNLNLGLMLAKANRPDAVEFLRAATRLKPLEPTPGGVEQAWLALAHLVESSDADQALAAYQEAAKVAPTSPEPHLDAAALLFKQNQFAAAENEYKNVLALDPTSSAALIGIANIYARGNRLGEAAESLRKLLAFHPDYAAAHVELARILAADDNHQEAILEYRTAVKLAPDDHEARLGLAQELVAAGRYEEAQPVYQALLTQNPKDPMLHYSLGQAYMKQGKFSAAEKEFLLTLSLKPDYGAAYGDLAFAANGSKNYRAVIQALDTRAKFLPELPETYFLRATAYDHLRAYKQAALNYHLFLQASNGQYRDQEWQARHRLIAIEPGK